MTNMFGGWSGTMKATEEVQKICDQVKHDVEKKTGKNFEEFKAHEYREQVVAGMNYLIRVLTGDSSCIDIELSQALLCNGGRIDLKGVQENQNANGPLELFPPF